MKKAVLLTLCIASIIFMGCTSNSLVCNRPYIQVGTTCCLDINDNAICDIDEALPMNQSITGIVDGIIPNNEPAVEDLLASVVFIEHSYAFGSGVVISKSEGKTVILTAKHVVEAAQSIGDVKVIFSDNQLVTPSKIYYAPDGLDLAVLELPGNNGEVALVDEREIFSKGEDVVALGSPIGFKGSITSGIVSNMIDDETEAGYSYKLIQTDAALNPGNSGGGLFLKKTGHLIGINALTYIGVQGVSFAIPIKEYFDHMPYNTWKQFTPLTQRCADGTPYDYCSLTNMSMYCSDGDLIYACYYCGCPSENDYCMPSQECYHCPNPSEVPWEIESFGYACCLANETPSIIDDNNYGCCPKGETLFITEDGYTCCPYGSKAWGDSYSGYTCCKDGYYLAYDGYCYPE